MQMYLKHKEISVYKILLFAVLHSCTKAWCSIISVLRVLLLILYELQMWPSERK